MFAGNVDWEPEKKSIEKKTLTKIKSHQELSLEIRNQQVLFPSLATMLQAFFQLSVC